MSDDHIPDRLEIYINEQRADLGFFHLHSSDVFRAIS